MTDAQRIARQQALRRQIAEIKKRHLAAYQAAWAKEAEPLRREIAALNKKAQGTSAAKRRSARYVKLLDAQADRRQAIFDAYAVDLRPTKDIATEFGCSTGRVLEILRRVGREKKPSWAERASMWAEIMEKRKGKRK